MNVRWLDTLLRNATLALLLAVLAIGGTAAQENPAYRHAVEDAAFAESGEITTDLVPITKNNPDLVWNTDKSKLLVVTWKTRDAYHQFLKPHDKTSENRDFVVWVTAVPQVKRLCANLPVVKPDISKASVELRLKQYLGLNPQWQYDVFVELWVDPAELLRPCVDPQIDDRSCGLHFGNETPKVKNVANYRDFYEHLYYRSFRGSAGVPWTGLGYTYDWGNPDSEVGASEYILVPGASYKIKAAVPTMEYCGA